MLHFKRTRKAKGTMWTDYNRWQVWTLDWLIGFAEVFDGLVCIFSLGFIASSVAFNLVMFRSKFMTNKMEV